MKIRSEGDVDWMGGGVEGGYTVLEEMGRVREGRGAIENRKYVRERSGRNISEGM